MALRIIPVFRIGRLAGILILGERADATDASLLESRQSNEKIIPPKARNIFVGVLPLFDEKPAEVRGDSLSAGFPERYETLIRS